MTFDVQQGQAVMSDNFEIKTNGGSITDVIFGGKENKIDKSNSMSESYQSKYDQRNSNNQFVDTAQTGSTPTFNQSNYAPEQRQNLAEAAADIQQLLTQLQTQGYSQEQAQQQAAQDLSKKADNDPTVLGKLVKWGQSLSDTATKTTVSEAAKEVFKIALRLSGIPIP